MKKSIFLLLLTINSFCVFSQEEKVLNIGTGMPFFLRSTTDQYSDAAHSFSFSQYQSVY